MAALPMKKEVWGPYGIQNPSETLRYRRRRGRRGYPQSSGNSRTSRRERLRRTLHSRRGGSLGNFRGRMERPRHSPEEEVCSYPSKTSPPDNIAFYNSLIKRAADTYGVLLEEEKGISCFILATLAPSTKGTQYLPMLPSILDQGKEALKEPASAKGVTPRVERKFKPSTKDRKYIQGNTVTLHHCHHSKEEEQRLLLLCLSSRDRK